MEKFILRFLCAVALCSFGGAVNADTVVATFTGVSPGQAFHYRFGGPARVADAGEYTFERTGGDYDLLSGSFTTFCIEINQPVRIGRSHEYEVVELANAPFPGVGVGNGKGMGADKANDIQHLWANYYRIDFNPVEAAAFQIAIWEILYDDALLLDEGAFQARRNSGKPVKLAQEWLNKTNWTWTGALPNLLALTSPGAQDQLFLGPTPEGESAPVVAVPLPASVWAGIALLAVLMVARQWRSRHQAA